MEASDWRQICLCGTEWHLIDNVYKEDWNFDKLEEAVLNGELKNPKAPIYLFGTTEPQLVDKKDGNPASVILIPTITAIVNSPIPPPPQLGIKSVQKVEEEMVTMQSMKMDWVPYIPRTWNKTIDKFKPSIFYLHCSQRRKALKNLNEERLKRFEYCLPFIYLPHKDLGDDEDSTVNIVREINSKPLIFDFDYKMDSLNDVVEEKIAENEFSEDLKDTIKEAIKEEVKLAKAKNEEKKEAKKTLLERYSSAQIEALKEIKFFKYYPIHAKYDISQFKSSYINRYYGHATNVF